jgi:hypothetical protein
MGTDEDAAGREVGRVQSVNSELFIDKQTARVLKWLLIVVLVGIVTLLAASWFLYKEQGNEASSRLQADRNSDRERAELRQEIADLRQKYEALKGAFDKTQAHYGNRAIIQKAVVTKMIEKGMFPPEVARMLLQMVEGTDYPKEEKWPVKP